MAKPARFTLQADAGHTGCARANTRTVSEGTLRVGAALIAEASSTAWGGCFHFVISDVVCTVVYHVCFCCADE
jgi:hypothetical protein